MRALFSVSIFFISGILLLSLFGCAHDSVFTNSDLHLYSGTAEGVKPVVSDSLVCISYNIAFAEKLDQALVDLKSSGVPRHPDILLLQEMDEEGTAYIARNLGLNYYYFPSFIHPHHGRLFGNAVLSPWPLSGARGIGLPHANPLTNNFRAALAVDVHTAAGVVQVVSAHMSTLIVDLDHRVDQVVVMRDSLISLTGPVIVGGDFNTGTNWEGTLFRRVMRQAGFRETRPPWGRTARGGPLDLFGYHLKLDHFYYRDLDFISAGVCRETWASDHFPIWSVFKWPQK